MAVSSSSFKPQLSVNASRWPSLTTWASLALHYLYTSHGYLNLSCWFFSFLPASLPPLSFFFFSLPLFSCFLYVYIYFLSFSNNIESSGTVWGPCLSYLGLSPWSLEQSLAHSKCSISVCWENEWVNEKMWGGIKSPEWRSQSRIAGFYKSKHRRHQVTFEFQKNNECINTKLLYALNIACILYLELECKLGVLYYIWQPYCRLTEEYVWLEQKTLSNLCLVHLYGLE